MRLLALLATVIASSVAMAAPSSTNSYYVISIEQQYKQGNPCTEYGRSVLKDEIITEEFCSGLEVALHNKTIPESGHYGLADGWIISKPSYGHCSISRWYYDVPSVCIATTQAPAETVFSFSDTGFSGTDPFKGQPEVLHVGGSKSDIVARSLRVGSGAVARGYSAPHFGGSDRLFHGDIASTGQTVRSIKVVNSEQSKTINPTGGGMQGSDLGGGGQQVGGDPSGGGGRGDGSSCVWEKSGVKDWNMPGSYGDLYVYRNPYRGTIDLFALLGNYSAYFPTNHNSDSNWQYTPLQSWRQGATMAKCDVYLYNNPYSGKDELFGAKHNGTYGFFPINQTSNHDWAFLRDVKK